MRGGGGEGGKTPPHPGPHGQEAAWPGRWGAGAEVWRVQAQTGAAVDVGGGQDTIFHGFIFFFLEEEERGLPAKRKGHLAGLSVPPPDPPCPKFCAALPLQEFWKGVLRVGCGGPEPVPGGSWCGSQA